MKHRFGSLAAALGCVTLLVVACGGSDFEGPSGSSGNASGGSQAAGAAGKPSGGSASGGSASGGSASGGATNGGSASGGSASGGGGMASGGGGMASGGSASGGSNGDPLKCEMDSDCVQCAYPTAPQTEADCYCANCANKALSKTACTTNQAAWTKVCSKTPRPCPAIACLPLEAPKCKSKMCVAGSAL